MRLVDLNSLVSEPLSHDAHSRKHVIFKHGEIPHLTQLAQARTPPGIRLTPHAHSDMHEIFIVLAGQGEARSEAQVLTLAPGMCIHIQPQESHAFANTGANDLVLLYFGLVD